MTKKKMLFVIAMVVAGVILARLLFGLGEIKKLISTDDDYAVQQVTAVGGADCVLAGCRNLIRQYPVSDGEMFRDIGLSGTNLPDCVKDLHAKMIIVQRDHVMIDFSIAGRRVAIVGFNESASQYGSKKIIDGLWFWNGTPSTETRRIYQEIVAERKEQAMSQRQTGTESRNKE